jgi:hypothetical protein
MTNETKSIVSKRVKFECINGKWIGSMVATSSSPITPGDIRLLERNLKLSYRKYVSDFRREQALKEKILEEKRNG